MILPFLSNSIQAILSQVAASDPLRIILFGFWAQGEADGLSDIDLVVILESEEPFIERIPGLLVAAGSMDDRLVIV